MRESDLDFTNDRYATLKLVDWFDVDLVRSAKVLVVGAGAIGNEVLKNLALLGIGHIYLLDRDTIEISNLSRSILYRKRDCGLPKALVAARAIKEINPDVNVHWQHADIESGLGEGFLRRMDAVIGCLDSVDARFLLNRLCWRAGRPWVDAGIGSLNGQVRVFRPPQGPCYECSLDQEHYRLLKIAKPCNAVAASQARQRRIPTTPTIASLVAAVQVQEALKLLDPARWEGRTLAGRQFIFDGTVGEADIVGLPIRPDCPAHVEIATQDILECADLTVEHTAGDLLARAREIMGPLAHLYLGSEIAIRRQCPACGAVASLFRPVDLLESEELTCSHCGRPCVFESDIDTTHIVGSRTPPEMLAVTMSGLGVPRFGFVEARSEAAILYLELTGDAAYMGETESTESFLVMHSGG